MNTRTKLVPAGTSNSSVKVISPDPRETSVMTCLRPGVKGELSPFCTTMAILPLFVTVSLYAR